MTTPEDQDMYDTNHRRNAKFNERRNYLVERVAMKLSRNERGKIREADQDS